MGLVILGSRDSGSQGCRVLRILNLGLFWRQGVQGLMLRGLAH